MFDFLSNFSMLLHRHSTVKTNRRTKKRKEMLYLSDGLMRMLRRTKVFVQTCGSTCSKYNKDRTSIDSLNLVHTLDSAFHKNIFNELQFTKREGKKEKQESRSKRYQFEL
jgi:hypothetical protein